MLQKAHRVSLLAGDALSYVWISTSSSGVAAAGANSVPTGTYGALIKGNTATSNAVYTSYPDADYSSPVIHTARPAHDFLHGQEPGSTAANMPASAATVSTGGYYSTRLA